LLIQESKKAYTASYTTFGAYASDLATYCVYRISVEIYYYNQLQPDPTIISGTVSERTISVIYS
jgi:hypothetical protein